MQNPQLIALTTTYSGSYSVTVTDANSCTAVTSTNVIVNALPTVTCSNNSPICDGSTLLLSSTGGVTYSWSGPNGFTSSDQNPIISQASPLSSGVYTVLVTSGNTCTNTTSTTVIVNSLPIPTANNTGPICEGDTIFFNSNGGNSYNWSGPNGFTSNSQNPFIPNTFIPMAGQYFVTVTDSNNCFDTTSTNLTIYTITANCNNNSPLCAGNNLNFNSSGGISYLWSGPNGFISSLQSPSINNTNASSSGIYTVTVTDIHSCSAAVSTAVIINALPIPNSGNNSPICDKDNLNFNSSGGNTYLWSGPNGFTSTEQNPTILGATLNSVGNYSVTVTDLNMCTATTVTSVAIYPLPVTLTSNSGAVCSGNSITLYSSGGNNYAWNGPQGFTSNLQNPIINSTTTLNSGIYTVTVSDINGCSSIDTTNVTIYPLPISAASSNTPICYGDNLQLSSNGGNVYSWSSSNGFTSNLQNPIIPFATPAVSGMYVVTVTDIHLCSSVANVSVLVPTELIISTTNQTICNGLSTSISMNVIGGVPPYNYFWDGVLSSASVQVNPIVSTIYSGQVEDAYGCMSNTSNLNVFVKPPVKLEILSNYDSICPGESIIISGNISQGDGGPYLLYLEDGTIINFPYTLYPESSKEYIIYAKDGCGSIDSDTLHLYIYNVPPLSFNSDKTSGCIPLSVQFNETSNIEGQSYIWNFGDYESGNLSYIKNPLHVYNYVGSFTVSLLITSIDGCRTNFTFNNMINTYPKPEAIFLIEPQSTTIINPEISFKNISHLARLNYWMFGDGDSSNVISPVHIYSNVGSYDVRLITETENGCRDTSYNNVEISPEFTFYAPTVFSPDNDGINDYFFITGEGIDKNDFMLIIFDRWGEIIFKTDKYDESNPSKNGWDGSVKGAKNKTENGIYTWLAIYKDIEGSEHTHAGVVTIIK